MNNLLRAAVSLSLVLLLGTWAFAQEGAEAQPKFNVLDALGQDFALPGDPAAGPKLFLSAQFQLEQGKRTGRLSITAEPAPGWHTYSTTQKGGPQASKLKVATSPNYKVTGPFVPDQPPQIKQYEYFPGVNVEEYHEKVTWTAPLALAEGIDPAQVTIAVTYDGQVCQTSCIPLTEQLIAKYAGTYKQTTVAGPFRGDSGNVEWRGHLEPKVARPGSTVKLVFTATPPSPYHVYTYFPEKKDLKGFEPTLIALRPLPPGWKQKPAVTDSPIVRKASAMPGFSDLTYHEGAVTWTIDVVVPESAEAGTYELSGLLGYQACTDTGCDLASGAQFRVPLEIAANEDRTQVPIAFAADKYKAAEELAAATAPHLLMPKTFAPVSTSEVAIAVGFGLLGGLILNLMPCVLPVIGLKILSFAEQAGQHRSRVLMLNVVYAAGILSVFMVLASLAVFLNLGWGEHFGVMWFQVAVTAVVFAMALSFLGVWEIPLPGFIGAGKTTEISQEGMSGAFVKGIITTVLSTPCSGPFLGSVFSLTLRYPPYVTYLIFASVGLGMASPYLIIGAFPRLVRWLPKPGEWMKTLKEVMGFVLLGTVVYLFSTIGTDYRIATLTLLVGIWFGCWLIGRTPIWAEFSQKLMAWSGGIAVAAAVGWGAFMYLGPHSSILPWQPFTPEALAQARAQGKTVMIEFTADWCPTCQVNYKFAIDTEAVQQVVEKNGVVPMIADWSDRGETIKQKLAELDSTSIPLLAIYPADGGEPIVLRDLVVQSQVVEALEQAGPSKDGEKGRTELAERVTH